MAITAKVRNKQIDTGKVLHALVQGENASGNITFQIIGEEELVEDFNSTYFYLLYTRPSDTRPNVLLLTNKQLQDDVISVTFKPTSYFTAQDGTVQIQIMATDTEGLSVDSETGTISGSVIWQTFPGAMFVHASQLTGTETIIEENVLTQYLAGMQELYSQTEDAEGDAADSAQLAKDWASKTNGAVEGGEMSAKYYAGTADSRAKEAEGYAVGTVSGSPSATFAGKNAKELASDAQDWAKGTRSDGKTPSHTSDSAKAYAESAAGSAAIVSAHAEAIDAIGDDLTNIDAVAADILDDDSAIDAVAANITNVNAVAANETNINAVNTNKTNINTVAGKATEITTVAGIASDVAAVSAIASDVAAVEDIDDDVSAVAAIAVDVGVVADAATDVAAVADELTDIGTVASNISDVAAVGADIAKVSAVADDLTSINAVYADLANIDAADDHALEAEGWAAGTQNGVPVTSGSPYYENNAKYYGQEIPNLKDAIQANSNRISNLEQEHGGYTVVNYRGTNAVPTGKAKYGLVESIVGKSRAWNQLVQNGDFSENSGWSGTRGTLSIDTTNHECSYTVSEIGSSTLANRIYKINDFTFVKGHKLLVCCDFYSTHATDVNFGCNTTTSYKIGTSIANQWTTVANIIEVPAGYTNDRELFGFNADTDGYALNDVVKFRKMIVRDLTLIFPEGVPVDVAGCVAKCPDLLKYDAFGTSMVDETVSGVRAWARNLWNEVWELGVFDTITGNKFPNAQRIRSADYIDVIPNTTCYAMVPSQYELNIFFYDADKNFLYNLSKRNDTFVIPANCKYIRFYVGGGNITTYGNNICINKSDSDNGTYTPYWSPVTLTLPSPVTLRSAGTGFEDTLDVETGEISRKCAEYTITGNESFSFYPSTDASLGNHNGVTFPIPSALSGIRTVLDAVGINDIGLTLQYANNDKTIYVSPSNIVMINDAWTTEATFVSNITGKHLVFALQDFGSTSISPVIDNTIATEGGGTINTIQNNVYPDESPAPTIDNSMDVGYLAL